MSKIKCIASITLLHGLLQASLAPPSLHLSTLFLTRVACTQVPWGLLSRSHESGFSKKSSISSGPPGSLLAQMHVHLNAKCQSYHCCLLIAHGTPFTSSLTVTFKAPPCVDITHQSYLAPLYRGGQK